MSTGAGFPPSRPRRHWMMLSGADVHWVDFGGPATPQAMLVCVHGLNGSTVNWEGWGPLLTDRFRVVALDLVGHGSTRPGTRSATVAANAELVSEFVDAIRPAGAPVVLVGSSMGGLISAYAAAGRADIAGLVLVNAALPRPGRVPPMAELARLALYSVPPIGRANAWGRRRFRTPEQLVNDLFRLCMRDVSVVDQELFRRHVEAAERRARHPELDPYFAQAAQSTVLCLAAPRVRQVYARVRAPVLMVHGTHDRVIAYTAAQAAADRYPWWTFVTAHGGGHAPMLDNPAWLARVVTEWLDRVPTRDA
ncbi:MAG: alpha/beta hydrolase [Micrococcales bacterium]|nr:MAG: alpha/beta hydrolase [Micrococcales bacterium]PIE26645.1 MAG: alpha/beta hydrolase [Micrococcales bacterium]